MPENEFEKQVQMKMDGLKLRPSGPVWEKIRADIHERKRRRFFIMLSVTAAALLFGWISYNYFLAGNTSKKLPQETTIGKENSINTNKDKEINDKNAVIDLTAQPDASEKIPGTTREISARKTEKDKAIVSGEPVSSSSSAADQNTSAEKQHLKKIKGAAGRNDIVNSAKFNKRSRPLTSGLSVKENRDRIGDNPAGNTKVAAFDAQSRIDEAMDNIKTEHLLVKDNTAVSLEQLQQSNQSIGIADKNTPDVIGLLTTPDRNPAKFSTKLKVGVTVSGGISSRTKQPFGLTSSTEKSAVFSDVAQNYFNLTPNISGGVLVLPPSEVKPGAAFKAGFTIEKPLSRRFTVSSGLQYAYSSDHITIGKSLYEPNSSTSLIDRSAVAQTAYGGNPGVEKRNYTNQYHFIELPVMVQYTINKRWNRPFVWNFGASVGRLVSTNALLYDEAYGGIYYDGKNDIKKTQINLFTGFAWQFNVNRMQWSVGPQVAVNTSKLFDNPYDNNLHPVSGAISLRLLFPGKKK